MQDKLSAASAATQAAREATAHAMDDAAEAKRATVVALAEIAFVRVERDAAISRAEAATRDAASARRSFSSAASSAPDTCTPVVVAAQAALSKQDSVEKELREALNHSRVIEQRLQQSVDTLLPALTRLQTSAGNLVAADKKLANAARTSLLVRLLPHPGAGVAFGLDPLGQPRLVTGFTLSWSF